MFWSQAEETENDVFSWVLKTSDQVKLEILFEFKFIVFLNMIFHGTTDRLRNRHLKVFMVFALIGYNCIFRRHIKVFNMTSDIVCNLIE